MREYQSDKVLCFYDDDVGDLGTGSFGTVRLAHLESLEHVAVKCFLFTGSAREKKTLAEKFARERDMLGNASHEYIVRVYGWVRWPGAMAIVMEYLPGGNLKNLLLNMHDHIAPVLCLRMSYEMSCGIALIHNISENVRMAHGDLKPENIVLTGDLHCKLGDFGCAQIISYTGSTQVTNQSKTDQVGMTMAYAAPERLNNPSTRVKKEQDTYSYGIILHMVLSCEPPYFLNEFAYTESVRRGQRPDLEAIEDLKRDLGDGERHIVEFLESIMKRCWQQEPSQRPQMTDVREELSDLFNQQDRASILRHAADIVDHMDILIPSKTDHHCVPLHRFSARTGGFDQDEDHVRLPQAQETEPNVEASISLFPRSPRSMSESQATDETALSRYRSLTLPTSATSIATVASLDEKYQKSSQNISEQNTKLATKRISAPDDSERWRHQTGRSVVHQRMEEAVKRRIRDVTSVLFNRKSQTFPRATGVADVTTSMNRLVLLMQQYCDLVRSESYAEANERKAKFTTLIADQTLLKERERVAFVATEDDFKAFDQFRVLARNLESLADRLRSDKQVLEATLLYDVTATFWEKASDPNTSVSGIKKCVWGLGLTVSQTLATDLTLRPVVVGHVIPLMRDLKGKIRNRLGVDEAHRNLQLDCCSYYLDVNEHLVETWNPTLVQRICNIL